MAEPTTDDHPALDDRKVRILRAIVAEYVTQGEPVGSKRVVDVAKLDVSPATVRNEMAVLEELGYISQPHTSAGRIPTDAGYRYFVDELGHLPVPAPDARRRELVQELLGDSRDVEDLLARTTHVLSQLTRLVSLVIAPAIQDARLKLVELVGLTGQTALLLMVSDTGRVEKRIVEVASGLNEAEVERVRMALNEHVRGRRMGDVHDAVAALASEAPAELRDLCEALTRATDEDLTERVVRQVFVAGQGSLVGERTFEREQLSQVLELLEERSRLVDLIETTTAGDETSVRIGEENELEGLEAASLVAQRYRLVTEGSLGVLGPTRMDYVSVLATVRAVAEQLEETLADLSDD
jgi:heat-inducible transcriptional repressor